MTEPLLNDDEIRDLLKHSVEGKPVTSLWEGEAPSYDLLKSGSNAEGQISQAEPVHRQVATLVQQAFLSFCGGEIVTEFIKHDSLPAKEAIAQTSLENWVVVLWSYEAKSQEGFFLLDKKLFFHIYSLLLGGSGSFEKKGALTSLEKIFLGKLLRFFQESFEKSWASFGHPQFTYKEIMDDQEKWMKMPWNFDGFKAHFQMKIGDVLGEFFMFFPNDILSNFSGVSDAAGASGVGLKDAQWQESLHQILMELPIKLSVQLGAAQSDLKKIFELKPGDELPLVVPEAGNDVYVLNKPLFKASIGVMGGVSGEHRAIQIIEKLTEESHG